MCIQYNQTYVDPGSAVVGSNLAYYIISTNDTAVYPGTFFMSRFYSSGDCEVRVYNETWNYIDTITFSPCSSITDGAVWTNISGSRLVGIHNGVGTDYAYSYNMTGGDRTTLTSVSGTYLCDWYQDLFYCGRGNYYSMNVYNNTFYLNDNIAIPFYTTSKPHVARTNEMYAYFLDPENSRLYFMDMVTPLSMGYIDIEATFGIDLNPLGLTGGYIASVLANNNDSKLWIAYRNNTGDDHMSVAEFEVNLTHSISTIGISTPADDQVFSDNNIVIEGVLNAYYDGELNCSIDGAVFYTDDYLTGLHTLNIPSGTLADGEHNLSCIFIDEDDYSFSSGSVTFYINEGFSDTGVLGVGDAFGEYLGETLGFEDDDYSTANDKGLFLLSIIICLLVASVIAGMVAQHGDGTGVGLTFVMVFIAMFLMFTFVGWLPAWIFYIFFIIAILITAGFLYNKMAGG